jgi:DNA-binding XRE family transcriptional regulator
VPAIKAKITARKRKKRAEPDRDGFVRRIRHLCGLTQQEFADLICKDKRTIIGWENGWPFPETARRHIELMRRLKRIKH